MFARGFLGVVPTKLVQAIADICKPQDWRAVYVACSGTFRTERALASMFNNIEIHSNDVSLLSSVVGRAALGDPLPFQFIDELAFVEELGLNGVDRVTAILLALDYSSYAKGTRTRFKVEHCAHLKKEFANYVQMLRPKIARVVEAVKIKSYYAGDFRDHIETAIKQGAGVIAYPPTFKGGYERMFQFVDDNTEWQRPSYRVFDPKKDVVPVLERLKSSGAPFFLYLDQEIEGFAAQLRYEQPGKHTIFGYGQAGRASFRMPVSHAKPFTYHPVELAKIHANSKLWALPAPEAHIAFLRECFLARNIMFGSGDFSLKLFIDDMLLGAISYRKPMSSGGSLYVLTDMTITREGRLAKLVARAATCREAFKPFEHKLLVRFKTLTTTAFSEYPEAMKYRGSWKVRSREGEPGKYKISYISEIRDETLSECFAWWWKRDGANQVAAALSGTQTPAAKDTQAA